MIKSLIKITSSFLILSGIVLAVIFTGCEKKVETPQDKPSQVSTDTTKPKVQPPADTVVVKKALDLTGKWSGTFDQRSATLKITGQNDTEFTGTLSVAYREPLTKAVSGKMDKETMNFTMTDTQHSRYEGSYSGKITDESKMSGTFKLNTSNKNYNFSLTKK